MLLFSAFMTVVLGLFGGPLFAVILGLAVLGFLAQEVPLSVLTIEMYRLTDTGLLAAIPLFTFAGFLLSESNASQRLVRLAQAFVGWMPAGLALVTLVACAFFTAFTGASGATIVALGALLYPALRHGHYPKKFSLGLVTSAGSLGLLLPPSLPLILYGIIVQQMDLPVRVSIEQLFVAGIFPTLLMLVLMGGYCVWSARRHKLTIQKFSGREVWLAMREGAWELPLPFVVLGGIFSGFFAVSEAAAVTVLYVFVVQVFIYREIPLRQLPKIVVDAMVMVGGIMVVLMAAMALTNYFVDAMIPTWLFDLIQAHVHSKLLFLLLLNVFLLVLGALLDVFSALIVVVPLIVPVAISFGIDPVHLGIIFLANLQIGYLTPPVGMNLFIASYRFREPVHVLYRASWPFMLVLLVALLVITYWPALSLVLVR